MCALLSQAFGRKVQRALGQERDKGTDILSVSPYRIEVKRRKRIANLYDWLDQARGWTPEGTVATPVVALRGDDRTWLVVMTMADWLATVPKNPMPQKIL